jgi:hypothetical protein
MFFEGVIPNVMLWTASALVLVAVVLLIRVPGKPTKSLQGRMALQAYVPLAAGLALWVCALWVDGTTWLPGMIIASLLTLSFVVVVVWFARRRAGLSAPVD